MTKLPITTKKRHGWCSIEPGILHLPEIVFGAGLVSPFEKRLNLHAFPTHSVYLAN
jgi:hypothetical protein